MFTRGGFTERVRLSNTTGTLQQKISHQSASPFLSDVPPPKKNAGSAPVYHLICTLEYCDSKFPQKDKPT